MIVCKFRTDAEPMANMPACNMQVLVTEALHIS